MHKIFCFIFGLSFASFGMEPLDDPSENAQREIQGLINDSDKVCRILKSRENSNPNFGKNNVLLVGPTGVGKDSLLFYLKEIELTTTSSRKLEASAHLEGVRIGNTNRSETTIPASVVVDGITYWSCPGFGDTRGANQDLANILAISKVLRGNIKIVIVIDRASIEIERNKKMFDCLRSIKNNMLPNISKDLSKHSGLIVTRGEYESSQDTIQALLEDINNGVFNKNYSDIVDTVKCLIENHTAYFPLSEDQVYPASYRSDIIKMIQNIPDYLKLESDTVQIKIDPATEAWLSQRREILLDQINDIFANYLFKYIEILLDNFCKDFSVRKEMDEKIDVFMRRYPKQVYFADKIKDIRTKIDAVHKDSKQHIFLDNIRKFFMDILHENSHAVELLQQIKRISTHIEFVCKYYDAPSDIKEWTDGSHRLYKKLLHCENYISEKYKEAAIHVAVQTCVVGGVIALTPVVMGASVVAGASIGAWVGGGAATVGSLSAGVGVYTGGAVGGAVWLSALDAVFGNPAHGTTAVSTGTAVDGVLAHATDKDNDTSDQGSQPK